MCLLAVSPFVRVIGLSTVVLMSISVGVAYYLQYRVVIDGAEKKSDDAYFDSRVR